MLTLVWGLFLWMSRTQAEYSASVIDISHFQPEVDFAKVSKDGIVAVIHKATQGTAYVDPRYHERRPLAEENGLLWGAYHFAVPGNATEQADHFLETVGDTEGVLLVLDLEESKGKYMAPEEAEEFVRRVQEVTGRYPLVYGSRYFLEAFDKEVLNKCSLWIANYSPKAQPLMPSYRKSWVLWQYTDGQSGGLPRGVDGIKGPVDRNRYNGTEQQLRCLWPYL